MGWCRLRLHKPIMKSTGEDFALCLRIAQIKIVSDTKIDYYNDYPMLSYNSFASIPFESTFVVLFLMLLTQHQVRV